MHAAAGAALLAFIVGQNLVLNFSGFVYHVQRITGPYGSYDQDHDASAVSLLTMIGGTVQQLSWSMGWPSLMVCAAGVVQLEDGRFDHRSWSHGPSYYLFFIAASLTSSIASFWVCVILVSLRARSADLFRYGRWAPARRLACAAVVCYGLLCTAFVACVAPTPATTKRGLGRTPPSRPHRVRRRRGSSPRFAYGAGAC